MEKKMFQNAAQNQVQPGFSQQKSVGRIVSMVGSRAILMLHRNSQLNDDLASSRIDIGSLLAIETVDTLVLALVSGVSVPMPDDKNENDELSIAEMELMGELPKEGANGLGDFKRGVSVYPAIGDPAFKASGDVLLKAYNFEDQSAARIGTLLFDKNIPAFIQPDNLLGNHFAILGATGTGKSCSVALLLRAILKKNPNAHIILLDPHSEYSRSFGSSAEVVTPRDLNMPFWLLNFEEIVEVIVGHNAKGGEEAEILGELIPLAKKRFSQNKGRETKVNLKLDDLQTDISSVDTPVPYRMSDLISLLDENIGKLDQRKDISPFKRLKAKIESISQDPRYSFMFGSLTVNDTMSDILGRLFRIPVNGKPICIFELTGFPSEVVSVVVSVLCRMTFDFGVWSDGNVPITLVCEEAHRYVPSDKTLGFEPVKRSISRIAKEGRKYSVSLGVVTQRPAEIDPTILAQCNTLFSLRMANDRDQEIVKAAISDAGSSLLDILPSLGTGEAVVFGEGVALPARIKMDPLPPQALPKGQTADFTKKWGRDIHDIGFLDGVVTRWREQDINQPLAIKYSEDLNEPATQSAPQPAQQKTPQKTPESAAQTAPQFAPQPAAQPAPQPAPQGIKPAPQPAPQPAPMQAANPQKIQPAQPVPAPTAPQMKPPAQQAPQQPIQKAPPPQAAPQAAPAAQQARPAQNPNVPASGTAQPAAPSSAQQAKPITPARMPQGSQQPPAPQAAPQPAPRQTPQQAPQQAPAIQAAPQQPPVPQPAPQAAAPQQPAQSAPQPPAQPAPSYVSTDPSEQPPALQSGVESQPAPVAPPAPAEEKPAEAGAPIPGYQKLG